MPGRGKRFSSNLSVQTSSGAHPASCPVGTEGPSPGGKAWPGRDADHSSHIVPRSRMSRSLTSSPPLHLHVCVVGLLYLNICLILCYRAFGRFVDGGLIANNPTMDALTEIHEYNVALKATGRCSEVRPVTVVVSLGTGHIPVTEVGIMFCFLCFHWCLKR
jgi:hypothetical protein